MSLFRHRRISNPFSGVRAAVAGRIGAESQRRLRQLASHLASVEKRMSRGQKMISISIFCLAGIFFSLALLLRAVWLPPPKSVSFLARPGITRPVLPSPADSVTLRQMQARLADTPSSLLPFDSIIKK
jgi:hypothetical protein